MKKVLLTTTALIATAGIAMAEVSLSGSAEMGLASSGKAAGSDKVEKFGYHQDIGVSFSLSGSTDNGLSFGGSVALDEAAGLAPTDDDNGTSVYISGGFGKLSLGDVDGALDWAVTEADSVSAGSLAGNESGHDGYAGAGIDGMAPYDGQVLSYTNSFGNIGISASTESPANSKTTGAGSGMSFGATYDAGVVKVGLGMQNGSVDKGQDASAVAASVSGNFGGVDVAVMYQSKEVDTTATTKTKTTAMQLGAAYTMGATTFSFLTGSTNADTSGTEVKKGGGGIAVSYDLGGGASVKFGANNNSAASVGLSMSF